MMGRLIAVSIFIFCISSFYGQDYYSELRKKYWEFEENDDKAFNYINLYIVTAKKQKNYSELFQAYDDAIKFSSKHKLKYADSAIAAAKMSGNNDLIGNAYLGKGTVYYFTYRKFQPALNEYLTANKYLENSEDFFLKYQNLYHIGVIKSYLGHYEEASKIFNDCVRFFESNLQKDLHPNIIFNNRRGYYNSLHQLIVSYQGLKQFNNSELLIKKALKSLPDGEEFSQERSYFYKSLGVNEFYLKRYDNSLINLNKSLSGLKKINDFSWSSVVYFYLGLSYSKKGETAKSLENYKKVDSIFNQYTYIIPDVRNNYEELIKYYRNSKNPKQELYYTKQLLKVDSVLSYDFKYLSNKIHKDYETKTLLAAKAELEETNNTSKMLLLVSLVLLGILVFMVFYWFRRKKEIQRKYDYLIHEINSAKIEENASATDSKERNSKLDSAVVTNLRRKFAEFEKNKGFLEKGITAGRLATEFETNATYLSQFMNEFKESNFNTYINKLRIKYAADQIYRHKDWRKYSVEDIANACGFSNRQSFSNFFYEQNGIRPAEFLKKVREEMMLQKIAD
ncbi:AraC-type DNA-binding protein [Chryseobacterium formosense]|uniref:helix-turn-helix domain-containing protein n=2 Tax=Chryseobacterium formosense TaxID=236814 RepID=UPI0008EC9D3D|nr:helix-turn-helix domain-containing protein [Chryseobacterium formosense]SFT69378.1 AraC-type DNA-binding protein [Chryseobacterium formosense]